MIGRHVAIKVMKREIATQANSRARFLREARAAAAINHRNIVDIYLVGEDQGTYFIAMPLLAGESLKTRLGRLGRLEQDEVLRIGRETASGLAAAHDAGLIHRDIKPDNLWMDADQDRIKILDFGLARAGEDDAGLTQSGAVLGTPKYMAPEQATGETVDHRCDLFSLGSVLYHLASGQVPFQGKSLTAVLIAVSQAETIPIEQIEPGIDPDLAALIGKLLSRDPNDRPQSAQAVVDSILAIEAVRCGERAIIPTELGQATHRTHGVGKPIALGCVALVLSAVVWMAWRASRDQPTGNTETGVAFLQGFPKLRTLNLSGVKLSTDSIGLLGNISSLRDLILNANVLTASQLEAVSSVAKLRSLVLDGIVVDESRVRSLSESLPACRIQYTLKGNRQRTTMRNGIVQ